MNINMLILSPDQQAELATLNETGDPLRRLTAVPLTTGDAALSADLLTDCAPGQTWEHYQSFLESLPEQGIASIDIVEAQLS
jgi:hypothetical protein